MRILQAMAGAEFGGAEAFFVRLVIALRRAGVEQRVVIRENPSRASLLRAGGIEPLELPFGGALDWQTSRSLKKEISAFKPDIVLTWMNRATLMCPQGDFVHLARLGGYYDLKYYQKCDHLLGNTADIISYLGKQGWPEDRAHYLPNFVSAADAKPLLRKHFFTPDTVPLILGLGRLHENKAFDVLLKALARVPNAYLWIAGDGPLREDLDKLSEKLAVKPRVRFLGWRDDVPALMKTSDLLVCPSRHEPLGNVVIEAWAQNLPVVAADSYGPGTLIKNLESGVLVPVDDEISMAKAIRMTLEDGDLRKLIVRRGRAAYDTKFTEQIVVGRYMELLDKVLG